MDIIVWAKSIVTNITKDKVTAMASIIAAIVGILGIMINIRLSKKQRTAQFISQNRIEWIKTFKDYMTEYIDKMGYFYDKSIPDDIPQYMQDIYKTTAKIKLHLNFQDEYDKEILNEMDILNLSCEKFMQFVKYKKDKSEKSIKQILDYYDSIERGDIGEQIGTYFFNKFNINKNSTCKEIKEGVYNFHGELTVNNLQ